MPLDKPSTDKGKSSHLDGSTRFQPKLIQAEFNQTTAQYMAKLKTMIPCNLYCGLAFSCPSDSRFLRPSSDPNSSKFLQSSPLKRETESLHHYNSYKNSKKHLSCPNQTFWTPAFSVLNFINWRLKLHPNQYILTTKNKTLHLHYTCFGHRISLVLPQHCFR